MNYKKILDIIAKEHHTTTEDVEKEMRNALQLAGYDIDHSIVVALAKLKIEKTIYRN